MLKKNLVLGSVASLAVAVAIGPAFAQSPPQYPDYSLPWEAAETAQLNAQQASEPGIITSTASIATPGTTGAVASTDNSEDIQAYNQALANAQSDQSQFNSQQSQYNSDLSDYNAKQSSFQQSWQDYQNKLSAYNQQVAMSSAPAPATTAVISQQVIPQSTVVSEQIINRPAVQQQVVQESFTRPVIREQTVMRPVVRERTVMQPRTVWEPVTQRYVENQTVTQPVVSNEVVTRPVVREQIVNRPVVREVIEHPLASETIVAANTAPVVSDEWVTIYPHHERLVVLNTISNPDAALRGIPVMDRSGKMIGTFQHMTLQDNGVPKALITLNDNKTVAVADDHLRIDPMAHIVVADLTYGQMDSMPAIG